LIFSSVTLCGPQPPGPRRGPPDTLYAANILAANLREDGDAQAARDLDQDTLDPAAWSSVRTTLKP
jgi:hypothetical protein